MKKRLLTVTTIIMTIILLFPHAGGISNASIAESIVVEADRVQMLQQPLDDLDDEITTEFAL